MAGLVPYAQQGGVAVAPSNPLDVRRYRFGTFEANLTTGELWNNGHRLKIQAQPFEVLAALLEHPGGVVSREDLHRRLWPADTFVDFDLGLNVAIKKLRDALGDSAEQPRFIETLSRRGYRFVAPVEVLNGAGSGAAVATAGPLVAGRRWRAWTLAAAALAVVAGVYYWATRPSPLRLANRGWLLVARFENHTGEAIFDDSVEYALTRDLGNSGSVRLVPPERVQDTLLLMRKRRDTPLDAATARELALRDGNVNLILTGRIEKLGATYVLSSAIVDPAEGATLASFREEATDAQAVLPALQRLSVQIHQRLGEAGGAPNPQLSLSPVTTGSLHALKLYSAAQKLIAREQDQAAIPLLLQAVEEDPNFAMAHLRLGQAYVEVGSPARADPHYEEAFRLAGSLSDLERYRILRIYYRYKKQWEKAAEADRALLQVYPDEYSATDDLAWLAVRSSRLAEATALTLRLAKLRPNDFLSNYLAWEALTHWKRDPVAAAPFAARARQLIAPEQQEWFPHEVALLAFDKANDYADQGQLQAALAEAERLTAGLDSLPEPLRDQYAMERGAIHEELLQIRSARIWYQKVSTPALRLGQLFQLEADLGNPKTARGYLEQMYSTDRQELGPMSVVRIQRLGLTKQAAEVLRLVEHRDFSAAEVEMAKGGVAFERGQYAAALAHLQPACEELRSQFSKYTHLCAGMVADALERQGRLEDAAAALESARLAVPPDDPRTAVHLLVIYRNLGRTADAEAQERRVRQILALADADHPLLVVLQHTPPSSRRR